MKEPRKAYAAAVLVALVVAWIASQPQPLIAQRAPGVQPYPPPKPNQSSREQGGAV